MHTRLVQAVGICFFAGAVMAASAQAQSQAASGQPSPQSSDSSSSSADNKPKDSTNTAPAKKVYTNDDLRSMHGDNLSVVGNSPQQQKKPATNNGANNSAKIDERQQAQWHNRAQRLRDQLAEVDRQIAQLNANLPANTSSLSTSSGSSQSAAGSLYGPAAARLQNLQNRKATIEQQIEQLEEEARKAGIPPGWLR